MHHFVTCAGPLGWRSAKRGGGRRCCIRIPRGPTNLIKAPSMLGLSPCMLRTDAHNGWLMHTMRSLPRRCGNDTTCGTLCFLQRFGDRTQKVVGAWMCGGEGGGGGAPSIKKQDSNVGTRLDLQKWLPHGVCGRVRARMPSFY